MRAIQPISLATPERVAEDSAARQPVEGEDQHDEGGTSLEDDSAAIQESQRAVALSRLKAMPLDTMRHVAHLDMLGDYGSKINFLIKHLLHYKIAHPGGASLAYLKGWIITNSAERHVIFSNWQDSLNSESRLVIASTALKGC